MDFMQQSESSSELPAQLSFLSLTSGNSQKQRIHYVIFLCALMNIYSISASYPLSPQKSHVDVETKGCHSTDMIELVFGGFTPETKGSGTPAGKKH